MMQLLTKKGQDAFVNDRIKTLRIRHSSYLVMMPWRRSMALAVNVVLLLASLSLVVGIETISNYAHEKLRLAGTEVYYNGAVAAEHPRCSEIGVEAMEQGGSAVDAAISGLLCVGVINNFAAGIGGGGFMLVRDEQGRHEVIDFREVAAATAHKDMFNNNATLATDSTLGAGVPGEIRGFAAAHAKYGQLPWSELFKPSIKLARDGFAVTPKLETILARFAKKISKSKGMRDTYFRPDDGLPKRKGDFIFRPNLANTLEMIAKEGPDSFYQKSIAENLTGMVQSLEGGITMSDMKNYTALIREPLVTEFAGFKLITAGVPTSGAIVAQILKVIERLKLDGSLNDVNTMHRIVETFKHAFVDRMKLGDPEYVPDTDKIISRIVSDSRIAEILSKIKDGETFPPEYYLGGEEQGSIESHGTTHLTAMDCKGRVASVTSTVNLELGCGYMEPNTGIVLNNQLDDFSIPNTNNSFGLPPSSANYIEGGKRPMSSAAPVILERDGHVLMALGGAGGSRIITAVAEMIVKVVVFGLDPDDAMESCRLHNQLIPNVILAEQRCDRKLLRELNQLGHNIVLIGPEHSGTSINLVMRNNDGGMVPISDMRKGGIAAGY